MTRFVPNGTLCGYEQASRLDAEPSNGFASLADGALEVVQREGFGETNLILLLKVAFGFFA